MDPYVHLNNVVSSLYRYTTTTKSDTVYVRNNLRDTNAKHTLWISYRMKREPAHLPWIMSTKEVNLVYNVIKTIKTPT